MDVLNNRSVRTILFSSIPKRERMCCIVGYVTCSEKYDSSAKSDYHWQIFRCRQLIFSESEIIASPSNGKDGAIYIVMTDDFYRTGKVQLLLEKLYITSRSPEPVSNVIYEACFRYTLVARISPLWNQVDCYLIEGRDFLLSTSALNAIKLEVITRDGDMFMSVWPLRIRLPQLQKENMDMGNNCGEQCVSVLPSLKKVRVRALSPHIPDSCPFKTYKELKRHWKNMYGYRLPEKPEKLFFCSLSFHSLSPILYTYPSLCVRQHDLVFLRHMDHNTVLQTFLKNLAIKLPTLCGYPFGVESRIVYAVPKLCHWSESLAKANLCENLLPANKSEFLSSVPKSTTLSNQQNSTDNAETENKLPPAIYNCLPQIEMYNVGKDILKQQEKMIPVFKRKLCASVAPQSVNSVIIEKKQSLPGDFQSLPNMNYDSVTLPNKVPIIVNKKPRSRPQVQTDVDVEALARNRDLARVNTATLVNWLRTKNVPCKVKDRKSHLVEKVMNHLNLPQLNEILT